jgi:predicted nucleotidyltransferase
LETRPLLQSLLRDVVASLQAQLRVRSIVLFGSVARGEERSRSDIDLIIVSDEFPKSYSSRFDLLRPIFQKTKGRDTYLQLLKEGYRFAFSAVPYRPEDLTDTPPLLLDVVEDGIILYDDGFMRNILTALKEKLRALGSRRIRTRSGRWYWILKPDIKPGEIIQI